MRPFHWQTSAGVNQPASGRQVPAIVSWETIVLPHIPKRDEQINRRGTLSYVEKRYWRKSENIITYIREGGTLTEVRLVIFAFCFHGCYQFVPRSSHGRRICKLPAWWCTCPGIWLMPEKTTTFVDPNFQPYPISLLLRDIQAMGIEEMRE